MTCFAAFGPGPAHPTHPTPPVTDSDAPAPGPDPDPDPLHPPASPVNEPPPISPVRPRTLH